MPKDSSFSLVFPEVNADVRATAKMALVCDIGRRDPRRVGLPVPGRPCTRGGMPSARGQYPSAEATSATACSSANGTARRPPGTGRVAQLRRCRERGDGSRSPAPWDDRGRPRLWDRELDLALARQGLNVIAVDISPAMLKCLQEKASQSGLAGITCVAAALVHFDLPPGEVDLVVSNYAFHFLRNRDKEKAFADGCLLVTPGWAPGRREHDVRTGWDRQGLADNVFQGSTFGAYVGQGAGGGSARTSCASAFALVPTLWASTSGSAA